MGRRSVKPLDLSITAVLSNTESDQSAMKGGKYSTLSKTNDAPNVYPKPTGTGEISDAYSDPEPEPETESEISSDPQMHTPEKPKTRVDETLTSASIQTLLTVIPPEYWLIKPPEVTANNSTKGIDDNVNMKGSNSINDSCEDSDDSKETILSRIEDKVTDMFVIEAEENKCVVPLERLSDKMIKSFQPSSKTSEIDPYSSLDEVSLDDSEKELALKLLEQKPMKRGATKYDMRERKKTTMRHSEKPLRSNRTQIDYSKLFALNSDSDPEPRPKPVKSRKHRVMSEPSNDRIAAQEKIKINSNGKPKYRPTKPDISKSTKKRFFRKDPSLHPPPHRKRYATDHDEQELKNNTEDIYGGDTEIDEPTQDDSSGTNTPPNKLKGKFHTRSHGLRRKKKRMRFFTCGVCGTRKTSTHDLNRHFKLKHEPLICKECDKAFTTPSGLARHKYTHEPPRFPCDDCDKKFFFSYELKQHRITHLKVRAHFCNYGNCTRGFMNNADLLKHVRTHTTKKMNCKKCEYSTTNPRLMTSHQKKHSNRDQFQCSQCLETFRYRNQLRRHLGDVKKCHSVPKRSDSPVF